jgi:hypothetical protein
MSVRNPKPRASVMLATCRSSIEPVIPGGQANLLGVLALGDNERVARHPIHQLAPEVGALDLIDG